MTNQHPITPPPELVEKWEAETAHTTKDEIWHVAVQAAQWGADQEMKACCDHMRDFQWGFVERPDGTKMHRAVYLEQSRRPQPPSLKEQSLQLLETYNTSGVMLTADQADTIRHALEALND